MSKSLLVAAIGFLTFASITDIASAETKGEVIRLFNGESLDGWTTADGEPVTQGWTVEDGLLVREERGGHIYSEGEFNDFQLDFEWKIDERGNSGVKYRIAFYKKGVRGKPGWLGCEYQLLDDERHPNAKNPTTTAGALYSLYAPSKKKELKPLDQFNHSRIIVRGTQIEHWLNGKKIVSADTSSDDWKNRIAGTKFEPIKGFAQNPKGRIMLQDHGSKVWFRNITVTPIEGEE